ncbi:MAG TPA: hypothetical protein VHI13_08970 [Candidatus Kapabacteria bacterium]|nr:hypothetical protein [Candidatus Kapabacteria bacterium]
MGATATYTDDDAVPRRVLCAGAGSYNARGFGVVLWNEMPGTARGISFLDGRSLAGKAQADERRLSSDAIPGRATHLWFLPQCNALVVLIPEIPRGTRSNGLPHARRYFRNYLHDHSRYAVMDIRSREGDGISYDVTGWRAEPEHEPRKDFSPRFETHPHYQHGILEDLPRRIREIRKIVTDRELGRSTEMSRTIKEVMLGRLGFGDFDTREHVDMQQRFRFEMSWTPGAPEEVAHVIEQWKRYPSDKTGVMLIGDATIHWFDRARSNDAVTLPKYIGEKSSYTIAELADLSEIIAPRVLSMLGTIADPTS